MGKPAVGSGTGHSNNVARGAAVANAVKDRWLTSLLKGELKFSTLASASYSEGDDRHLAAIRLYTILKARPGWTINTVLTALEQNGFDRNTKVSSVRRSKEKIDIFEAILETSADRWRGRPPVPAGWPWNGKLSVLTQLAGESLPSDIASLFADDEEDELPPAPAPAPLDDISSFFDED